MAGLALSVGYFYHQQLDTVATTRILEPLPGITDQHAHVQAALDALGRGRKNPVELVLKGEFVLSKSLLVDSFTTLDLRQARLDLQSVETSSVLRNRAGEAGNRHIWIVGGIIKGNRDQLRDRGGSCILLENTSYIRLENLVVSGCALDGITLDGRGKKARFAYLNNLVLERNYRDGLVVTWAMRDVSVDTVTARHNRRHGVYADHSESDYRNIRVSRNASDGMFIRNVFHSSYRHIRATENGRHGIAVLGMVESYGGDWRAHNNGTKEHKGPAADIFFSADDSSSYGINARSLIDGVIAGPSEKAIRGASRYALWVEPQRPGDSDYRDLSISNVLLTGEHSLPDSSGVKVGLLTSP